MLHDAGKFLEQDDEIRRLRALMATIGYDVGIGPLERLEHADDATRPSPVAPELTVRQRPSGGLGSAIGGSAGERTLAVQYIRQGNCFRCVRGQRLPACDERLALAPHRLPLDRQPSNPAGHGAAHLGFTAHGPATLAVAFAWHARIVFAPLKAVFRACSNLDEQPAGMRVLGETQLSRIISELEGSHVVQLFAQDLQQHEGDEAQQKFLRELFLPHLPPGAPALAGEHERDAERSALGWRVIGASQAPGDTPQTYAAGR